MTTKVKNDTNLNLPNMSVEKIVDTLSRAYCEVIARGESVKLLPSVMMWGAPGIGKSQAVRQIGDAIRAKTGKTVHVTDVRLLLFNPIDLRGIPTANEDKTLAIWLKPQIFQMDESDRVVNILFLDEISAAPPSVQAAAYQITLDRVVGEHKLPDNCIVIAAGNRVTDKSVAYKMPKALANRLLHIEVEGSFESWQRWAVKNGINRRVLGYLSFRRDRLFGFRQDSDDLAFATPRSWEMVSNIMNHVSEDLDVVGQMVGGLVGIAETIEFKSYCKIYADLPSMTDIFSGRTKTVPRDTDRLYAVVTSMIAYAREHSSDIFAIGNSLKYASLMPSDFARMLIHGYMIMKPDYDRILTEIPEYRDFIRVRGEWLNGRV